MAKWGTMRLLGAAWRLCSPERAVSVSVAIAIVLRICELGLGLRWHPGGRDWHLAPPRRNPSGQRRPLHASRVRPYRLHVFARHVHCPAAPPECPAHFSRSLPPARPPADLRAAAAAAAKQALGAGKSTVLADEPPPATAAGAGDSGFKAPPPRLRARSSSPANQQLKAGAGEAAAGRPAVAAAMTAADSPGGGAENPLASLLGYDDVGSPRSPAAPGPAAPGAADGAAAAAAGGDGAQQPASAQQAAAPSKGGKPADAMDAQLADFLSELESSGLLKDDEHEQPQEQQGQQQGQQGQGGEQAAAADSQQQQQQQQGGGGGGAASAASSGPAEQKVLGSVDGPAGWFLVLDTASRQQYFWHQATNEVAWTAPAGATLPAATAAAAEAAKQQGDTAAAGAGASNGKGEGGEQVTSGPQEPQAGQQQGGKQQQAEQKEQQPAEGARAVAAHSEQQQPAAAEGGKGSGIEAMAGAFLAAPSAAVLEAAEQIAHECTEAAGDLLDAVPKVGMLISGNGSGLAVRACKQAGACAAAEYIWFAAAFHCRGCAVDSLPIRTFLAGHRLPAGGALGG